MVPIDVQGAYIMLPVDIQAQYLTLEIDIKAQTIEHLDINIDAQQVGVYLQPAWSAKEGTDKDLNGSGTLVSGSYLNVIDYTVPEGKTFYACQWGAHVFADIGVAGELRDYDGDDITLKAVDGGRVGFGQVLDKVIAFPAGHHVYLTLRQWSGGDVESYGAIGGFEL
jgi:hypothetical protein